MKGKAMKERSIIFSGPMVRAIIDGRKTQTRRVIRKPERFTKIRDCAFCATLGQSGERLWVKETWSISDENRGIAGSLNEFAAHGYVWYRANNDRPTWAETRWRSPILMPRWASRLTLEITDVRVERVQDISEQDAICEGVSSDCECWSCCEGEHAGGCWMCGGLGSSNGTRCKHCGGDGGCPVCEGGNSGINLFARLWDSINAKRGYGWDRDPWCWAYTFKLLDNPTQDSPP